MKGQCSKVEPKQCVCDAWASNKISEGITVIKTIQTSAILTSMMFVTACGGGSTSTNTQITMEEADEFFADASGIIDALTTNQLGILPTNDLIAQGTANYTGFTTIVPGDTFNNIVGRTEISANFADGGSIDGRITDLSQFVESEAQTVTDPITGNTTTEAPLIAIDGTLILSNGNIQEEAPFSEIDIHISGSIVIPARTALSQQDETYDISGAITGSVTDDKDLVAIGTIEGDSGNTTVEFGTLIIANPVD